MERDYIVSELTKTRWIGHVTSYQSGQHLAVGRLQHYVTDGNISVANLLIAQFDKQCIEGDEVL